MKKMKNKFKIKINSNYHLSHTDILHNIEKVKLKQKLYPK